MEASIYIKKEEDIEADVLTNIIKKEEDITPKVEDTFTNDINYNQIDSFRTNINTSRLINNNLAISSASYTYNLFPVISSYHHHSIWPTYKPFIIIRDKPLQHISLKVEDSTIPSITVKEEFSTQIQILVPRPLNTKMNKKNKKKRKNKKIVGVSGSRNYIGLVSVGLARAIGTAEEGSDLLLHIEDIFHNRKVRYDSLKSLSDSELVVSFQAYIYATMCGKKVKKTNRDRDFKIRNSEELEDVLAIKEEDDGSVCLRKEVLREMVEYFFDSDCYEKWVTKGMMKEANQVFFIDNREELKKKFLDPLFYKPRFIHE